MDDDGPARLAQAVEARRLELGLSVRAAAARADINRATWGSLEGGERRLSRHLWQAVEATLQWTPGSVEQILGGGAAIPQRAEREAVAEPALPPDFDLSGEIDKIMRLDIPATQKLKLAKQIRELYEQAQAEHRLAGR